MAKTPRLIRRMFGVADDVGPGQYAARLVAFVGIVTPVLGVAGSCGPKIDACYPYCQGTPAAAAPATTAVSADPSAPVTVPAAPVTVAFYGDSRAYSMAEGARQGIADWTVTNEGVPGCGWRDGHPGHQDASVGDGHECGTEKYIPQSGHHDLAIVYAGTLLAQDILTLSAMVGVDGYDPGVEAEIVHNVERSLGYIDADRIIVLGTPIAKSNPGAPSTREYIDRMNLILGAAAKNVGAAWMPEFAWWVEEQGDSCQPDGTHFTLECGAAASAWVQAAIS